jgi:hypothetical protein
MGTRGRLAGAIPLALLALTACSGDDEGARPHAERTTDADCAERIPDHVFSTLGWTPTGKPAEATVRGCHREAEQGYVEVRDRRGYHKLCATLDRSGGVAPGSPVDWLSGTVSACAVEPAGDLGTTKVVVERRGDLATQVTVTAVSRTERSTVRAAVAELVSSLGS